MKKFPSVVRVGSAISRISGRYGRSKRTRWLSLIGLSVVVFANAESFSFRDGNHPFQVSTKPSSAARDPVADANPAPLWLEVHLNPGHRSLRIGRDVILTLAKPSELIDLLKSQPINVRRQLAPDTWLVRAPDALTAARTAAHLASQVGVLSAYPSYQRTGARLAAWATAPHDPYFTQQTYLESPVIGSGVAPNAADLQIRTAWPTTRGEGVVVAVCDDGVDGRHPELLLNLLTGLNHNFFTSATNGAHSIRSQFHGTAVAGLIAARDQNFVGISGTAPRANLCSWVLFDQFDNLVDIALLADLFQFQNDRVAIQNHSWGNADFEPLTISTMERNALSNAATLGRAGRGVVHVRSAGNSRVADYNAQSGVGDANLDGFANEPHALTIGGVRLDGRVTSYSTPGACLLVSALGGEQTDHTAPFTLDAVGNDGLNTIDQSGAELADYLYPGHNEAGTSFTAPQISGLAALLLSANPDLTARDVELLLALSARPTAADPVTQTNGAGLLTNDNVGFGVPHAGLAIALAQHFTNFAKAWIEIHVVHTNALSLPDDGFRIQAKDGSGRIVLDFGASGGNSALLDTRQGFARLGLWFPLVAVGPATTPLTNRLSGKIALLDRHPNPFEEKLNYAAAAGAVLGIVADDTLGAARSLMLRNEFALIPGAFVTKADGDALKSLAAMDLNAQFRFQRQNAQQEFSVTNELAVHWVQVRARWDHPRQGDLRVTLISPAGTISLLQRPGLVNARQIDDWTYSSKQMLLEASRGLWRLELTDENPGNSGQLLEAELILTGPALTLDSDGDGLDDSWEQLHFGNLDATPNGDPDGDGLTNAAEQALGTNPNISDGLRPELTTESPDRIRLQWPAVTGRQYQIDTANLLNGEFLPLTTVSGRFPLGAYFGLNEGLQRYFRIRPLD